MGPADGREAGLIIRKGFGMEGRQMRVGERRCQSIPRGGDGVLYHQATGIMAVSPRTTSLENQKKDSTYRNKAKPSRFVVFLFYVPVKSILLNEMRSLPPLGWFLVWFLSFTHIFVNLCGVRSIHIILKHSAGLFFKTTNLSMESLASILTLFGSKLA
uniref:Uncharacterized protein n=1 Tax=Romanomermis culicivorax TaxID=13658 RepID=A0A915JGI2_ROMCU